ncbi:MAG: hypothetical protein KJO08_05380, partial [Gammaproteobacteria bacterium]|nr:hypothetical protein [Gammaproteobacteria bacterium]
MKMHEKTAVSKAIKLWIVLCVCSFISSGANAMWLSIDSFVEEYLDCTVGKCSISEPGMSFNFSTPDQTRFRHFSVD